MQSYNNFQDGSGALMEHASQHMIRAPATPQRGAPQLLVPDGGMAR